uniref:Uncharacterized protein n=1 Tax=Setaria digitata TaxID=48799 RepID=A0A915PFL4_9BILA
MLFHTAVRRPTVPKHQTFDRKRQHHFEGSSACSTACQPATSCATYDRTTAALPPLVDAFAHRARRSKRETESSDDECGDDDDDDGDSDSKREHTARRRVAMQTMTISLGTFCSKLKSLLRGTEVPCTCSVECRSLIYMNIVRSRNHAAVCSLKGPVIPLPTASSLQLLKQCVYNEYVTVNELVMD